MKSITWLTLAGAFLLSHQVTAASQTAAPDHQQQFSPTTVRFSETLTFVSQFNHEAYKIDIYIPKQTPPPGGFPALYVLDGDMVFGTFAEAMRNKSKLKEIEPAVVVGISGADAPNGANRTHDFTYIDLSTAEKSFVVDAGDHPQCCGYDQFYRTIQEEIKPMVSRLVPLNAKRESIFGWSLGGQCVLHTMLVHPDAFHGYIAMSPSIWWHEKALLADIPAFQKRVSESKIDLNLLLGVGEREEQFLPSMEKWGYDNHKFRYEIGYDRMVNNAQDLAGQLSPYFEQQTLSFSFKIFEGQTHNSLPWSVVNPTLDFEYSLIDENAKAHQTP